MTTTEQALPRPGVPTDTLAIRLMLARAQAGHLTITEAAARCGLGRASWQNWERGMPPANLLDVVEKIADKLHADPDWLLNGGPLNEPTTPRRRWAYQGTGTTPGESPRHVGHRPNRETLAPPRGPHCPHKDATRPAPRAGAHAVRLRPSAAPGS